MHLISRGTFSKQLLSILCLGIGIALVAGCSKSNTSSQVSKSSPPSAKHKLAVPKVPFANQPCQSLSATDLRGLGVAASSGRPARAPAELPYDNLCVFGKVVVAYVTQRNYESNQQHNINASRTPPKGLPGAFYDKQGGLWFAKDGYYVVVSGSGDVEVKAAGMIAARL